MVRGITRQRHGSHFLAVYNSKIIANTAHAGQIMLGSRQSGTASRELVIHDVDRCRPREAFPISTAKLAKIDNPTNHAAPALETQKPSMGFGVCRYLSPEMMANNL